MNSLYACAFPDVVEGEAEQSISTAAAVCNACMRLMRTKAIPSDTRRAAITSAIAFVGPILRVT